MELSPLFPEYMKVFVRGQPQHLHTKVPHYLASFTELQKELAGKRTADINQLPNLFKFTFVRDPIKR